MNGEQMAGVLSEGITQLLQSLYEIWGIAPQRDQATYWMTTDPHPIATGAAAGNEGVGTIDISPSGAFVLTKHQAHITKADHTAARDVYLQLESSGSGRRFTNRTEGCHVECIGGTDELPMIYPKPYLFDGGTTITITITNIIAEIRKAYIVLTGYRLWNVAQLNLTRRTR